MEKKWNEAEEMYFLEDNEAVQKIAHWYLNGFAAAEENLFTVLHC